METERRRYRRVACEANTSYSVISEKQKGASEKSITMNVSPGGVMFPVSHHIAPHTLLDIELFLPPGSFFYTPAVTAKAVGEVRWAGEGNYEGAMYQKLKGLQGPLRLTLINSKNKDLFLQFEDYYQFLIKHSPKLALHHDLELLKVYPAIRFLSQLFFQ